MASEISAWNAKSLDFLEGVWVLVRLFPCSLSSSEKAISRDRLTEVWFYPCGRRESRYRDGAEKT